MGRAGGGGHSGGHSSGGHSSSRMSGGHMRQVEMTYQWMMNWHV